MALRVIEDVARALSKRFGLFVEQIPLNVVPTMEVSRVGKSLKHYTAALNISAGWAQLLAAGQGKRVTLKNVWRDVSTGTTVKVGIRRPSPSTDTSYLTKPGTAEDVWNGDLVLDPGWQLGLSQGAVGDTAVYMTVIYEEEDALT